MIRGPYSFLVVLVMSACNFPGQSGATNEKESSIKYELVKDWPQLPLGYVLGSPAGIGTDSAQNIFVFRRASKQWPTLLPFSNSTIKENAILEIDRITGKIINSWGAGLFIMPHSLTVDTENNIWVTDVGLQQVLKFSHEGDLLLKVGEAKISGEDSTHFNRPTDIAVAKDGSFYVSDGYLNSRVVKFSASGHYLFSWGTKGKKTGEFDIPHSLALDEYGRVYVADRENRRIQIFDSSGRFLKEWKDKSLGDIYAIRYDKGKNRMIAAEYFSRFGFPVGSNVICFEGDGTPRILFGKSISFKGSVARYHDLTIDHEGNIYVGDILGNRIQKFVPISQQ
jgi:peptidylamidoglycolate lyase